MIEHNSNKAQHFLINEKILEREIEISNVTSADKIIEIGSGIGILTREILKKGCKLRSFEIDDKFKSNLENIKSKNVELVFGNALKYDWRGFNKIISNIPYYLSEPVLIKAIKDNIQELILIIGENFKEKLLEETRIGIIANLFFKIEIIEKVSRESFKPEPKVESYLIKLKRIEDINKKDEILRNVLIGNGKIKNSIINSLMKGKTKKQAKQILSKMNLNSQVLNKPAIKLTPKLIQRIKQELTKIDF